MTLESERSAVTEAVQLVLENGLEGMGNAVSILLNEAMKIEREQALGAGHGNAPPSAGVRQRVQGPRPQLPAGAA